MESYFSCLYKNTEAGEYLPGMAHEKAQRRAKNHRLSKLQKNAALYDYVIRHLKEGWSPEQIAGRMKIENRKYYACHETIYQYIYRMGNKRLYQYLAYKKPKRRKHFARKPNRCRYGTIRLITERPEKIALRTSYGHWEGDTIEFYDSKKQSITTLLERKSRLLNLIKNNNKKSKEVMCSIKNKFAYKNKKNCKTITFDQGSEFADYPQLEKHLDCKIYYCEPRSPWQKGSNENMNGRLRRYLPRHLSIHQITQRHLDRLANKMNNVPRKCLGYKKPRELFLQLKRNSCRTWG